MNSWRDVAVLMFFCFGTPPALYFLVRTGEVVVSKIAGAFRR